ncbi:DUF4158 domain-containing protein, partial [Streptomyces sp. NPDC056390]|uniref:DUF4158 domain-containing protein n=1 Tax=Streptomyces sp. NPDC056390 TaxID=3345806 RepID=UPI0035E18CD1
MGLIAQAGALGDEELEALRLFPAIGKNELIRYFTLTSAYEAFLRKFLRPQTILGVAVQLCTLPWLGFVPDRKAPLTPKEDEERLALRDTRVQEQSVTARSDTSASVFRRLSSRRLSVVIPLVVTPPVVIPPGLLNARLFLPVPHTPLGALDRGFLLHALIFCFVELFARSAYVRLGNARLFLPVPHTPFGALDRGLLLHALIFCFVELFARSAYV